MHKANAYAQYFLLVCHWKKDIENFRKKFSGLFIITIFLSNGSDPDLKSEKRENYFAARRKLKSICGDFCRGKMDQIIIWSIWMFPNSPETQFGLYSQPLVNPKRAIENDKIDIWYLVCDYSSIIVFYFDFFFNVVFIANMKWFYTRKHV